jgi:hypothetical protein
MLVIWMCLYPKFCSLISVVNWRTLFGCFHTQISVVWYQLLIGWCLRPKGMPQGHPGRARVKWAATQWRRQRRGSGMSADWARVLPWSRNLWTRRKRMRPTRVSMWILICICATSYDTFDWWCDFHTLQKWQRRGTKCQKMGHLPGWILREMICHQVRTRRRP